MSHTLDDRIIELADKYTLNNSNEDYLSNKEMLIEFKREIINKTCEVYENELRQMKRILNEVKDGAGELISVGGSLIQFRKAMEE